MSLSQRIERAINKDASNPAMSSEKLYSKWGKETIEAWIAHEDEKRKIVAGRRRKLVSEIKQCKAEIKQCKAEIERFSIFGC